MTILSAPPLSGIDRHGSPVFCNTAGYTLDDRLSEIESAFYAAAGDMLRLRKKMAPAKARANTIAKMSKLMAAGNQQALLDIRFDEQTSGHSYMAKIWQLADGSWKSGGMGQDIWRKFPIRGNQSLLSIDMLTDEKAPRAILKDSSILVSIFWPNQDRPAAEAFLDSEIAKLRECAERVDSAYSKFNSNIEPMMRRMFDQQRRRRAV